MEVGLGVRLFTYRGVAHKSRIEVVVRGVSGLRSVAALLEVGSPLTMYQMGRAEWATWATPVTYADGEKPAQAS